MGHELNYLPVFRVFCLIGRYLNFFNFVNLKLDSADRRYKKWETRYGLTLDFK